VAKTTKKDFNTFKKSIEFWFKKCKLTEWHLEFEHKELDRQYANSTANYAIRSASFYFNTEWEPNMRISNFKIHQLAKHETIHVLLNPLQFMARIGFASEDEVAVAGEDCVRKLELL